MNRLTFLRSCGYGGHQQQQDTQSVNDRNAMGASPTVRWLLRVHGPLLSAPAMAKILGFSNTDALRQAIDAATVGFTPDLVLISAGFDSMAGDPLGGFTLEYEDFEMLTRFVVERAEQWCGGRVVSALEGGYAPERLGVVCVRHMLALE